MPDVRGGVPGEAPGDVLLGRVCAPGEGPRGVEEGVAAGAVRGVRDRVHAPPRVTEVP